MKRLLLLPLVFGLLSCAGQDRPYSVLKRSTFTHPYTEPLRLYIALEKDRSGGQYFDRVDELDLRTFQERFKQGLLRRKLRIETFTATGYPTTVKLANPFEIVLDSTRADLILYLRIDGFEQGQVEVTRDRILLWNSFGITQYYVGYDRVPRVLVSLDAQLKEVRTGQLFYGFQARGVSVGAPFKRDAYETAMKRCEIRFYERLLKR